MNQIIAFLFSISVSSSFSASADDRYTYQLQDLSSSKEISWNLKKVTKPTIVFFWASWCQYCRQVLPRLNQEVLKKYDVMSISCDEEKRLAIRANEKEYQGLKPAYWLEKKKNLSSFVDMYPTLMIVMPGGKIDTVYEGSQSDKIGYFLSRLKYLMNESL